MFIDTIKTHACATCDMTFNLSDCPYDGYSDEYYCPNCKGATIEVSSERQPRWFSVAIYQVFLAYGGPEEGGWWYNTGERVDETVRTFSNTEEGHYEADRYLEALHAIDFPTKSSWHGERFSHRTASESLPDASFPRHAPRYS